MEQKFKFDHHTAIYHGGGRYTLTADEGYLLQTASGEPVKQAETKDYTQWHTIEAPATADEKPKRRTGKPRAAK